MVCWGVSEQGDETWTDAEEDGLGRGPSESDGDSRELWREG